MANSTTKRNQLFWVLSISTADSRDYAKMSQNSLISPAKFLAMGTRQQNGVDALNILTNKPILHLPLDDLPYKIEVDGHSSPWGCTPPQQQQQWKTVAFL